MDTECITITISNLPYSHPARQILWMEEKTEGPRSRNLPKLTNLGNDWQDLLVSQACPTPSLYGLSLLFTSFLSLSIFLAHPIQSGRHINIREKPQSRILGYSAMSNSPRKTIFLWRVSTAPI